MKKLRCGARTRAGHPCKRKSLGKDNCCPNDGGMSIWAKLMPDDKFFQTTSSDEYDSNIRDTARHASLTSRLPLVSLQSPRSLSSERLE